MENLPANKKKLLHNLITEIGRKNETLNNSPQYSILLGAGCSTPTIPLASKIIEKLKQKSFCRLDTDGHLLNKSKIKEEDFIAERIERFQDFIDKMESEFSEINDIEKNELLKSLPIKLLGNPTEIVGLESKWGEFKNKFDVDLLYGRWFETFSENAEERQEFIEEIIKEHRPPAEYIILSFLIKASLFKTIFTTNFDDFINEALLNYTDIKPRVIAHNEPLTFKKFITKRPTIIKLHGDYLFENIKNIQEEVGELEKNMFNKFSKALNLYDLIVVGYNGADASVMNAIEKIKSDKDFNLYWCIREGDNVHWRVKHLIETTKNCYLVTIKSFKELILQLWNIYMKDDYKIPDFYKEAVEKSKIISEYLNQTVHEAKVEKIVSDEVILKLEASLEHLFGDNTFIKIKAAKNYEERFEILKTYRIDIVGKAIKSIFENDRFLAKQLFKNLYEENIFRNKVIDAPIQHIGNAFSNLKVVDQILTEKIFNEIEDEIFVDKFKKSNSGDFNSALGELQSINFDKASSIAYKLPIKEGKDYSRKSLRELHLIFSEVNRANSFEVLESLTDEIIIDKMKFGKLDDIGFTLTKIYLISPARAKSIYYSVPNDLIISKIKLCYLERIGQNLSMLEKINNEKTSIILNSIENDVLKDKIASSSLRDFSSCLKEFVPIDRFISKRLYQSISEPEISKKISKASFTEICNALVKLYKIDPQRTSKIVRKIETVYFAEKLSKEKPSFEGIGSSLLNLRNLDNKKASETFKLSNFKTNLQIIAKDCEKSSEQSFFHYISTYLDLDYSIATELISFINSDFLKEILKWNKLRLYTSKLPLLLKSFDELDFKDSAIVVSKAMCENKVLLLSKVGESETKNVMTLINKYITCL